MSALRKHVENNDFILRVNSCCTPLERIHNASILCRNGMIQVIGGYSALRVLEDIPCVDMSDYHAVPGLLDTHLHGSGGFASMDADSNSDLTHISRVLAEHGVTSFVLTVLSSPPEKMIAVIRALAEKFDEELPGAVPVGIHVEGPFLNVERRGAQSASDIKAVDLSMAEDLFQAGGGAVKTMTFAPELDDSDKLIEKCLEHNVIPSMGHSMAQERDVLRAIEVGAARCTHLFNGMPPLSQRRTDLTSVGLTDDRLTIELIVDGVHVHPRMIDLACRCKPRANVIGISDATQGAGLHDGTYHLGRDKVQIEHGVCRRVFDGKLAGSCLTLDQALRNLGKFSSLPEEQILSCFTQNAAKSLNYNDRGVIRPGKRADIVVMDENWNVQMTIVNGRIVFDRAEDLED